MRWALAGVLFVGCSQRLPTAADNPTRIVDTSGATFGWSCDDDGCVVSSPEQTFFTPPDQTAWGWEFTGADRNYVIVGANWFFWERIVACNVDDDCPQIYQWGSPDWFSCVGSDTTTRSTDAAPRGVCERVGSRPLRPIGALDAQVLCQAPIQRPQTDLEDFDIAMQVEALVVAACGTQTANDCELPLPSSCLQPM